MDVVPFRAFGVAAFYEFRQYHNTWLYESLIEYIQYQKKFILKERPESHELAQ